MGVNLDSKAGGADAANRSRAEVNRTHYYTASTIAIGINYSSTAVIDADKFRIQIIFPSLPIHTDTHTAGYSYITKARSSLIGQREVLTKL